MRLLCFLIVLSASGILHAAEPPSWESLAKLFGQAKDSPEVAKFVAVYKLDEITKGPSGAFTPPARAYSLLYRQNRISTIVVRVAPWRKESSDPHWRAYSGNLPGDLSVDDGRDDVIKKLGMPMESRKNTWKQGDLHIWVHFNEKQDGINELYVSPSVIEAEAP